MSYRIVIKKKAENNYSLFRNEDDAEQFTNKQAYIANSEHPKFKESQMRRMDQFLTDTGYLLRVVNRIKL